MADAELSQEIAGDTIAGEEKRDRGPGLTLDEVATHNSEQDCYIIIGNANNGGPKVYDVSKYLDDHPGGAEVILEVAGKYADDMFEDIGHSNEARKELKNYLVGPLEATEQEIAALSASSSASGAASGGALLGVVVAVAAIGIGIYFYTQS